MKGISSNFSYTILGCGSSGGVPRLSDGWGLCDPENPKNRRLRCSLLVTAKSQNGETKLLIDTSPDLRQQLLEIRVDDLDGIAFTHAHADHMHGIDDLRMIFFKKREVLPVWADQATSERIKSSFRYLVEQEAGTKYPPILSITEISGRFEVTGKGGTISVEPIRVRHGDIDATGFRINNMAYIPDVSEFYKDAWERVKNLDFLIIDSLRRAPHPNHSHLDKTLTWIKKLQPKKAILTNMHNDLDYQKIKAETPEHVSPAYDGLVLTE